MLQHTASDSASDRKARGAFFTPSDLAALAVSWAVRDPGDRVLEPSCGDAAFLVPAVVRLQQLGCSQPTVHGIEIHPPSAESSRQRIQLLGGIGAIEAKNFFEHAAATKYDAIVGNPPYLRYQVFSGGERARAQQLCLRSGVNIGGLASSWAPFVVHAASMLEDDGRLALVLPTELLVAKYAQPIREFLLKRFARVEIVMFRERLFESASEETVLLMAEGVGPSDAFRVFDAKNVADFLERRERDWAALGAHERWGESFIATAARDAYHSIQRSDLMLELSHWGKLELGAVTGANNFFALTRDEVIELRLPQTDVRRLSPPGSRHLRSADFALPNWRAAEDDGKKVYLFYPSDPLSPQSRAYIKQGEKLGIDQGFKCRNRSPWWRVPLVPQADLFFTYMNHDAPRLVKNTVSATHLNSIHGIRLKPGLKRLAKALAIAALNSVSLLGAEIVGRSYGGGILKLEPGEARRMPVPSPELVASKAESLLALSDAVEAPLTDTLIESIDKVLFQDTKAVHLVRTGRRALFERRVERARGE